MSPSNVPIIDPITGLPDCRTTNQCDCGICFCADLTHSNDNDDAATTTTGLVMIELPPSAQGGNLMSIIYDDIAQQCLSDSSTYSNSGSDIILGDSIVGSDDDTLLEMPPADTILGEPTFLGPVVTIEVRDPVTGLEINQAQAGEEFRFWLPARQAAETTNTITCSNSGFKIYSEPTCAYFDKRSQAWSTNGCRSLSEGISEDPSGNPAVHCACTHLTEFAVLGGQIERLNESCEMALSPAFFVFGVIYSMYIAYIGFTIVQLGHLGWLYMVSKQQRTSVKRILLNHGYLLVFCMLRCLSSFRYSGLLSLTLEVAIIFSLLAYFCLFSTYANVIKDWAFLHHFVMQPEKKKRLDSVLYSMSAVLVVFLLLCGLGLAGMCRFPTDGSICMCMYVCVCLCPNHY